MDISGCTLDKKRGIKNVSVSITFKILILIADVLVRRFLIKYIGNGFNGINSLYRSILSFLAVAELGVGSAITFCMYKPIVEGDTDKVSALYGLFTKLYLVIGGIIAVCGCCIMPALPYLAKDYQSVNVNLYLTFALMLASVVMTYMFSSKTSLINAYKNNYVTTTISSLGQLLQCGLQIVVLIFTKSFVWYLVCRIVAVAVQWGVTELIVRRKHGGIIKNKQSIDVETKKDVTKKVKAMFMHKIGAVLVNTADSIIISAFIGIVILGKYSNYTTIMTAMTGVLGLCFSPLTSVIGHMFVEADVQTAKKYHSFFHTFNFVLGAVFFLGYYAVIDYLVIFLFGGKELAMGRAIAFIITLNYFVQFMRRATLLFRDATGTFYHDRWKPLFEGLLNIGLSIAFVYLFRYLWGADFAVVGVIVATIITNIFICHIVEPHVLFKYAFKSDTKSFYVKNYAYILIFAAALVALHFCSVDLHSGVANLFANGFIAIALALPICIAAAFINKDFRHYAAIVGRKLKAKFGKKHAAATAAENGENVNSELPEHEKMPDVQNTAPANDAVDSSITQPENKSGDGDASDG
ncbi:MAG: hypothetical protein K2M89_05055 [Clostridiales bacterium]|nr:hypothetical protein [Clostridiales bacterium]